MPKTVFIVGAGASSEVGLPVGSALRRDVARLLNIRFEDGSLASGDSIIADAFMTAAMEETPSSRNINPYLHTGRRIAEAMPQAMSIDNFLDVHSEDRRLVLCGKLAIASAILKAEASSALSVDPRDLDARIDFATVERTWFNSFFQLLTENCKAADLGERLATVAMVVFNYDRCIEHYLFMALQNYYEISSDSAAALVNSMSISHPYGKVGAMLWQAQDHPANAVPFGAKRSAAGLLKTAGQLRTFTEGTDKDSSDIEDIQRLVGDATKIVFLGFAFHPLNLDLLAPEMAAAGARRQIFGTADGISDHNQGLIQADLLSKLGGGTEVNLRPLKCVELFPVFWRSLSLL